VEKISLAFSKVREFYRTLYNGCSTFEFIFIGVLAPLVITFMLVITTYGTVENYTVYVEKKACETNDHTHCPTDMTRLYITDARKCICATIPAKEE
jgi:predicted cobalt transporter CbtA